MVCLGTWRLNDIRGGVHGRLCPGTDPLLLVQWHGVPAEARGLRSHPSNLIWVIPAKGASLASCGTSGTSCRVHPASGSRSLASKRDTERVVLTLTVAFLLQTVPQVIIPGDSARDSTHVRRAQQLEAVQVTAIRGRAAPISAQTITRSELQRSYTGQETPILLQRAPGVTAYSESGSASNYSYIRLRGIDQTRINITLDGIPLNEPEDEALYFSNFPDFANSPEDEVTDRFHQDLLSVAWTHALSDAARVATTLYGFDAGGWYDYPGTNGLSDAYHYNLHSRWGGISSAFDWQSEAASASVGLNVARYGREHWLEQRPALDARLYDNTGYKGEQSVFAKGAVSRGRMTTFGDLQLRFVQFRYQPTAGTPVPSPSVTWSFVNPKVGMSVAAMSGVTAYASVGMNGREPTRSDMFAGADDIDSVQARSVLPLTRVHPETAYDLESGLTVHRGTLSAQANLFLMRFHNEIAAIGAINEIGYELRKNVDRSMRRGLEADLVWQATPSLALVTNAAVTEARIHEYVDDASGTAYHDVTPLMTPRLVSNQGVRAELAPWLSLDVDGRYVSRMMLTNTGDPRFAVPDAWYADAGTTLHVAGQSLLVQVRNVFDRRRFTGGHPRAPAGGPDPKPQEPYYYILAPRNVSVNARLSF